MECSYQSRWLPVLNLSFSYLVLFLERVRIGETFMMLYSLFFILERSMTSRGMNRASSDALNGRLPDGGSSGKTTLEELLKDDMFGPLNSSSVDDDESWRYQECLAIFVRGNAEECLQKMYEYGYLRQELLQDDEDFFSLFQEACNAISDYRGLGIRLQDVIRRTFTGDVRTVEEHFGGSSKASEMSSLNKYYKCCAKAFLMDSSRMQEKAVFLEKQVTESILKFSSRIENEQEASEVEQLVETYLFFVQIKLLQKIPSPALYKKLCDRVPNLSSGLSEWNSTHRGKNIESHILHQLERKHHKTCRQQPQRGQFNPASNASPAIPATPKSLVPRSATENKVQLVSKWESLWLKYFSRIHLSRQNLLVMLFLLLISLKSVKRIAAMPFYIDRLSKSLAPQVSNLLRLLSSI